MVSLLPSPAVIATKVVLILGANSAVAKVYASLLEKHGTPVVKVTRKECDLLDSASVAQYIIQQRAESVHFAYAIHFATTYSSADVKMARNVADLVDGLEIPRLIFTSSWVVLLQDALVSGTPYVISLYLSVQSFILRSLYFSTIYSVFVCDFSTNIRKINVKLLHRLCQNNLICHVHYYAPCLHQCFIQKLHLLQSKNYMFIYIIYILSFVIDI